jgi:D-beta-D-heptose 7-phosphate kinase/D-beta-D-heptose 1-phosphate adenosyltransferase
MMPSEPSSTMANIDVLLDAMRGQKVLVVGDLMLDRYVLGTVDRVSPEAPVPVVRVESEHHAAGGAANVAANVTALGAACDVVGCVGADAEGDLLRRVLSEQRIGTHGIVATPTRRTTLKTRVLAQRHQIVRVDREDDAEVDAGIASALVAEVRRLGGTCDAVIVQDYDKGVLAPAVVEAVRRVASERSIPWVVDPKRRSFFGYREATLFKPNARELSDALGEPLREQDEAWMEATRARLDCEHLLVTLGDRGMALQSKASPLTRLAAVARDVYDVSGAGDTVTAVVALALAAGGSACAAARMANHAAAVEVGKSGVRTVSADEIRDHARRTRERPETPTRRDI